MKKLLVLAGAVMVLGASAASAQTINLAWNNCITLATQAANKSYLCDGSAPAPFKGVMSFAAPAALAHFVGIQAVLDIQTADPTLPDYWRMGLGECRDGSFIFPASLTGIGNTASCKNPWAGGATGGGAQYTSQYGSPARARVLFAFARDTDVQLINGAQYLAGVFTIDTFKDFDDGTIGTGQCDGCLVPACLVLNQVELYQVAGQTPPQQDIYFLNTAGTRQYVTWQGGAVGGSGCPAATPTRKATWGSVKSLYR
jgi:hypothetical protein